MSDVRTGHDTEFPGLITQVWRSSVGAKYKRLIFGSLRERGRGSKGSRASPEEEQTASKIVPNYIYR
jgi:hypothetical protein